MSHVTNGVFLPYRSCAVCGAFAAAVSPVYGVVIGVFVVTHIVFKTELDESECFRSRTTILAGVSALVAAIATFVVANAIDHFPAGGIP